MKKRAISQDNTKRLKSENKCAEIKDAPVRVLYEEYYDYNNRKMMPVNQTWVENLGQEQYDFFKDHPDVLTMGEWYEHKGISPRTYEDWCTKYAVLKNFHIDSLALLGSRREKGALQRKYSEKMAMYTAHHYDHNWVKIDEHHSKQIQEQNAALAGNQVYIPMGKIEHKALPENDHLFITKTKEIR